MPNWCANRVTVWGEAPGELKRFMEYVANDDYGPFDFQQIIPMPEALVGIVAGSYTDKDGNRVDGYREVDGESVPVSPAEKLELLAKYGATNWYDWCCKNWGTKWNACHAEDYEPEIDEWKGEIEQVTYRFDTAWGPPEPICKALREEFPVLTIQWFWDEPEMEAAGYL
jgi:hypothetical protein